MPDSPRPPFRPLLWKELREVAPWFLGATAVAAGCLFASFLADDRPLSLGDDEVRTFFLLSNVVGALLLAVPAFGRVTTKDGWSLLLQRPASRRACLAVKVAVGLGAYALSQAVPLLAVAWWSSIPGKLAGPFFAAFTVPPLIDLAAGTAVYLAAALVIVREARWFGSRLLWFPAVALALAIAFAVEECWQALLAYGITLGVLAVALDGCWAGRERVAHGVRGAGWWATAAALGFGLIATGAGVAGVGLAAWELSRGPERTASWTVLRDGRTVLVGQTSGIRREFYADLAAFQADQPLADEAATEAPQSSFNGFGNGWEPSWRSPDSRAKELYADGETNWFYLPERRVYLGFDTDTRRLADAFGGNGFAVPAAVEPLRSDATPMAFSVLLINRVDGLWKVDLLRREQQKVADVEALGGPAVSYGEMWSRDRSGAGSPWGRSATSYVVAASRTRLTVQALDADADDPERTRLSMPLPGDEVSGSVYVNEGGFTLLFNERWAPEHPNVDRSKQAWRVTPGGEATNREILLDAPGRSIDQSWITYLFPGPTTAVVGLAWLFGSATVTSAPILTRETLVLSLLLFAWPAAAGLLQLRRDGRFTPAVAGWTLGGLVLGVLALPLRAVMLDRRVPDPAEPSPAPGPTAPLIQPLPALQ